MLVRRQRGVATPEQLEMDAEFLLEPPDLMADRGLRDVELGGCRREAQMPGRRLEGAQSIQGGQPGGHEGAYSMTLSHVMRHAMSFVESSVSPHILHD